MPVTLGLSERSTKRFLKVGNGEHTRENTQISRFYTAWTHSNRMDSSFSPEGTLVPNWSFHKTGLERRSPP
jgi:hypothetical protein